MSLKFPQLPLIVCLLLLLAAGGAAAQEVNQANAALSINGTGRVEPGGGVRLANASVSPTPAGSAPLYHHKAQTAGALEFLIQGTNPGGAVVLVTGPMGTTPIGVGNETLELDPSNITFLVDGTVPVGLLNSAVNLGQDGTWRMTLPQGLPDGFPNTNYQAAVLDPSSFIGFRLTGSLTLEIANDLETLARNTMDAIQDVAVHPAYLPSLASTGFQWLGADPATFVALQILEPQPPEDLRFLALRPNGALGAPPPTGAPAPGQAATAAVDIVESYSSPCASTPVLAGRSRVHDLQAVEEQGVWKLHGDQRDVEIEVFIDVFPELVPAGAAAGLEVRVEERLGLHGGVAFIDVSGPQLASVNPFGQATSVPGGTQGMIFLGPLVNGSEWELQVELGSAGTSRLPRVEGGAGAPDVYTIDVHWNDGTPPSSYAIPLRAAVDPDGNTAGALAAVPASTGPVPSGVLSSAGTPSATLALTFQVGTLTNLALDSNLGILVTQGALEIEVDGIVLPADGSVQTVTLCTPGLLAGVPAFVEVYRRDIFGSYFSNEGTFTF